MRTDDYANAKAIEAALTMYVFLLQEREEMKRHITRALEAWDTTPLPASGDGMLQERMECLRALVTATADNQPETGKE